MRLLTIRLWLPVFLMLACSSLTAQEQAPSKKEKLNQDLASAVADNKLTQVGHLLAQGADPNTVELEAPVLLTAVNAGYLPVAQLLLDKGAHIHQAASNGNNPMAAAVLQGNMPMVQMLLKHGGTIAEGETGMGTCAFNGHTAMLKFMLDKGVKVDTRGDKSFNLGGTTPLSDAALGGQLETVRFLLDHGANVNALSESKRTPLIAALGADTTEPKVIAQIVTLLVAKGAKVNAKSADDPPLTALKLAREKKFTAIVKILKTAGAKG